MRTRLEETKELKSQLRVEQQAHEGHYTQLLHLQKDLEALRITLPALEDYRLKAIHQHVEIEKLKQALTDQARSTDTLKKDLYTATSAEKDGALRFAVLEEEYNMLVKRCEKYEVNYAGFDFDSHDLEQEMEGKKVEQVLYLYIIRILHIRILSNPNTTPTAPTPTLTPTHPTPTPDLGESFGSQRGGAASAGEPELQAKAGGQDRRGHRPAGAVAHHGAHPQHHPAEAVAGAQGVARYSAEGD